MIIAEGARGERDFVRLLDQGFENLGMAVPLIDGGVGSQAIEVALAFDVINPDAFGALDHDVERMIVVGSVLFFQIDKVLGDDVQRIASDWHSRSFPGMFGLLTLLQQHGQQRHAHVQAVRGLAEIQRSRIVID